jgi:hypothetical protein
MRRTRNGADRAGTGRNTVDRTPSGADRSGPKHTGGRRSDTRRRLQRVLGNGAVATLVEGSGSGPRPGVGRSDSEQEREAEQAAAEVTAASGSGPVVRSLPSRTGDERDGSTRDERAERTGRAPRRAATGRVDRSALPPGGGEPLSASMRSYFEPRFGYDFGGVRVHRGPTARASAVALDAAAYTLGTDVVFGPGRYDPATVSGKRLIAHELAHVVQQGGVPESDDRRNATSEPRVSLSADPSPELRRQPDGSYDRVGDLVTFDPGDPGGETFVSSSAGGARALAVEAGVVEPIERSTADTGETTAESGDTTAEKRTVTVIPQDSSDSSEWKRVTPEKAERIRTAYLEYLTRKLHEVHLLKEFHMSFIGQKYGTDIDTSTVGGMFERGFQQMAHETAELAGGLVSGSMDFEPPPLSIWDDASKYLLNAADAVSGDIIDLSLAGAEYRIACISFEAAKKRFLTFQENTLGTGADTVLTTLEWTRDLSKGVFTGLAAAATGGSSLGIQLSAGALAAGGIEALTRGAEQSSEVVLGVREEYDFGTILKESGKAALIEAVAGLVAGPLAKKFADRFVIQFDLYLRGFDFSSGARYYDEFLAIAKEMGEDQVTYQTIRKAVIGPETGISVGLGFLREFVATGITTGIWRNVIKATMQELARDGVTQEELVDRVVENILKGKVPKEVLVRTFVRVATR